MSRLRRPFLCERFLFVTVKEYHEKVEYIHLNPVRRGLAGWRRAAVQALRLISNAHP